MSFHELSIVVGVVYFVLNADVSHVLFWMYMHGVLVWFLCCCVIEGAILVVFECGRVRVCGCACGRV